MMAVCEMFNVKKVILLFSWSAVFIYRYAVAKEWKKKTKSPPPQPHILFVNKDKTRL